MTVFVSIRLDGPEKVGYTANLRHQPNVQKFAKMCIESGAEEIGGVH